MFRSHLKSLAKLN